VQSFHEGSIKFELETTINVEKRTSLSETTIGIIGQIQICIFSRDRLPTGKNTILH
jgi:hypothetical protein